MLRRANRALVFQMKQEFTTPRVPLLFLLISIYIFATVQPVSDFSKDVQEAATIWSLDNRGVEHIRSVLLSLKENGVTIILASHYKEDISYLCDEVYQMDAGTLSKVE